MAATELRMFTIYERPIDYPDHFVVRGFTIAAGHSDAVPDADPTGLADTLEAARALVPASADACMTRSEHDDEKVVETWL